MTQVTGPLTINDGAATPVARSFGPERVGSELTTFTEKSAGIPAGFLRLGVGFSQASAKRATYRIDFNLDYPVLVTSNGVSSVAHTARFRGYFVVPELMSAADRANLHALVANSLDLTQLKAVIKDLDPLY